MEELRIQPCAKILPHQSHIHYADAMQFRGVSGLGPNARVVVDRVEVRVQCPGIQ